MRYGTLHDLLMKSSSSRKFLLSQPVEVQMKLHEMDGYIHTADELHRYAGLLKKAERAVEISEMLF